MSILHIYIFLFRFLFQLSVNTFLPTDSAPRGIFKNSIQSNVIKDLGTGPANPSFHIKPVYFASKLRSSMKQTSAFGRRHPKTAKVTNAVKWSTGKQLACYSLFVKSIQEKHIFAQTQWLVEVSLLLPGDQLIKHFSYYGNAKVIMGGWLVMAK